MHLPDLPPDLQFVALARDEPALRYAFEAKRAAMGPYIVQRWGWDEALQLRLHRERFADKPFCKIVWRQQDVGTLSLMRLADFIRFGEFYLFPEHQRRGIGSKILQHCLSLADAEALPVRLEYLKWNPVGSLYRRHGFAVVGETDIHWLMERPAAAASSRQ
jgi:GNAT superfamily N-acetyltransferase